MRHNPSFDYLSVLVGRSRQYILSAITAEILAILSVWQAQIPWPVSLGLSVVILCVSFRINQRLVYQNHPHSVKELIWDKDGWALQLADQTQVPVEVRGEMLITTFLIVLNFRDHTSKKSYPVALFADAVTVDEHRRLRVLLKTKS